LKILRNKELVDQFLGSCKMDSMKKRARGKLLAPSFNL
jgi:hypothetical protein